ncbi:MAG: PEP-CTERM sorting domain-containing protein [Akkermansia sp.]|nr:PEP-CTERM sorting domain-containing protein [Akkermansia sp.]
MKKTIIALLALAGVAAAAPLTLTSPTNGSLTSSNAPVAWSENYSTLTSWELSFTLADTALGDAIIFGTDRDSTGAAGYLLSTNVDGSLEVYARNINVTYSKSTAAGVVTAGTPVAITFSFVADENQYTNEIVGGTFTVKAGEATSSWAVTDGLEYTDLTNSSVSRFWTNGGAEQFSNITVAKLDNNMVVPEPTTATLSLLALAGLAARRRRK